jgi:hypothetical protein
MSQLQTETTLTPITITDKSILLFYKENPNLDLVNMNHIFINILNQLSKDLTTTMSNTLVSNIFTNMVEFKEEFKSFKQDFIKSNFDLVTRINDAKKEYLNDIQLILQNNVLNQNEKLGAIMEKNNESIINKTSAILKDIIPKEQEKNAMFIEQILKSIKHDFNEETKKLLNGGESNYIEYFKTVDKNFNNLSLTIGQIVNSCEERTNQKIEIMQEKLTLQHLSQDKLNGNVDELINKVKYNSQTKGFVSENVLMNVLEDLFINDEIINSTQTKESCDIQLFRCDKNKPTIFFENKFKLKITKDDVDKFINDTEINSNHGIFLSQHASIPYKPNFTIDIKSGIIRLYVSNVNYNADIIKAAVDIVDNLHLTMGNGNGHGNGSGGDDQTLVIEKADFVELLNEYNNFNNERNKIIEMCKENSNALIKRLDNLMFYKTRELLIKTNTLNEKDAMKCEFCNTFWKNQASLASHQKACKHKKLKQQQPQQQQLQSQETPIEPTTVTTEPIATTEPATIATEPISTTTEPISTTKPKTKNKKN